MNAADFDIEPIPTSASPSVNDEYWLKASAAWIDNARKVREDFTELDPRQPWESLLNYRKLHEPKRMLHRASGLVE